MHIVAAAGVLIVSVSCVTLSYPYTHIYWRRTAKTHASACSPRRPSKLLGANCSPRTPRLIRARYRNFTDNYWKRLFLYLAFAFYFCQVVWAHYEFYSCFIVPAIFSPKCSFIWRLDLQINGGLMYFSNNEGIISRDCISARMSLYKTGIQVVHIWITRQAKQPQHRCRKTLCNFE